MHPSSCNSWQFWVDRGGTFTDIIALNSQGEIHHTKVLSEKPDQYQDATIYGIKQLLGLGQEQTIPKDTISTIRMGTTVATNALLEHKGEKTLLCITKGFADILEIGEQTRPRLFDLNIKKPDPLYQGVIQADERLDARGNVLKSLDVTVIEKKLIEYYQQGFFSIAVCLMHAYTNPKHELQIADVAKKIGFQQCSLSHQASPMIKLIARSYTTVVDAYLSPILKRYIKQVKTSLQDAIRKPLQFIRSDGGLSHSTYFKGKDAVLSGPAGGVIGMVKVGKQAGFRKLIGFDMGGTSTDVCHYWQDFERTTESDIGGVRLQIPMMKVHTVAAGGSSTLHFRDGRFVVGPDSAGSNPGPACYGRGGPLTITDCNVLLNRINVDYFPKLFGKNNNQTLDTTIVKEKFERLSVEINQYLQKDGKAKKSVEEIAWGFLEVAVVNMANAIKKISIDKGYDVREYTLCGFGSAAGQHVCMVADVLGIKTVLIHPMAGLLSALGIGMSSLSVIKEKQIDQRLASYSANADQQQLTQLALENLLKQGAKLSQIDSHCYLLLRYHRSEITLKVALQDTLSMQKRFEVKHQKLFGFIQQEIPIIVDRIQVESIEKNEHQPPKISTPKQPTRQVENQVYYDGAWQRCQLIVGRNNLPSEQKPSAEQHQIMLVEKTSTNLIDPGWGVTKDTWNNLVLIREKTTATKTFKVSRPQHADPILLEVFNSQFASIAKQMGSTLAKTSQSTNIRERLDFSCALFDGKGDLVANANHIPVHLGSMNDSVRALIKDKRIEFQVGDVYMLNNPYKGGTHLPDITVITPVFDQSKKTILFFTASRGHHSDIGGIEPGSLPAFSTHIQQEGIIISNFQIVKNKQFLQDEVVHLLTNAKYPCRNVRENIADIKAQIAANECGAIALQELIKQKGKQMVLAYMKFIQKNAEQTVRNVISNLPSNSSYEHRHVLDNESAICVKLHINREDKSLIVDFTGTSKQHSGNFNAPISICYAAVLYVFRCLVDKNIPLNEGCFKPIRIVVPKGTILNPEYPSAVVAGNTEVSQGIVECLLAALGVLAGSQGTMNNLAYGNEHYQNYETICGGAGAGKGFSGSSAVHTHMTNTRLTDPEVLEKRYPVMIEEFAIRKKSGGKGQFYGGNGVVRSMRFLEEMQINLLTSNRINQPLGAQGGEAGLSGKNYIERQFNKKIERIHLKGVDSYRVLKDDVFIMLTPGGGGYG